MNMKKVVVPFGDSFLHIYGYYTPGRASNNFDEPSDPPEFEVEGIFIRGEDVTDGFNGLCVKQESEGSPPSYVDFIEWWLGKHWDSVIEQCGDYSK